MPTPATSDELPCPDDGKTSKHSATVLSERDRDLFLELLDSPPEPSPGLRQVLNDRQRLTRSDDGRTVLNFELRAD